ncbi:DNA-directed RNA polymerase [Pseudomonas sp. Os17]|nr:DNA-directed RNA polymerase [Pseudomonas sp. Os17]
MLVIGLLFGDGPAQQFGIEAGEGRWIKAVEQAAGDRRGAHGGFHTGRGEGSRVGVAGDFGNRPALFPGPNAHIGVPGAVAEAL